MIRRLSTASILLVLVGALCVIGMVMVGSASQGVSIATYGSSWAILAREILWMAVGLIAFGFVCRFDYHNWRRLRLPLFMISFALLLLVLVPGIGVEVGGSTRWIGIGQFQIQPSEIMKLALAVFGADLVVRREERGGGDRTVIGPLVMVALAAGGLILLQPDMGTALVLACITMALIFASGVSLKPMVKLAGVLGFAALVVALVEPYRRQRLLSFLDPTAHASGSGYQVVQSLIGLGSGHVVGQGLGGGQLIWGSLPNAQTDFIYSVVGEQLGIVGAIGVVVLLVALAWVGLRAAQRARDRFGALLAVAMVTWIASETFINVGAVIGLLPVTGIPLPFISFGGSSLIITLVAAGILVNVARQEASLEHVGSSVRHEPSSTRAGRRASVHPVLVGSRAR